MGHLREVVDGLVGVGVQRIQSTGNLRKSGTLGCGVRQNRLDGPHLGLVLSETVHDGLHRERVEESCSGSDCLRSNVAKRHSSSACHDAKAIRDGLRGLSKSSQVKPISSAFDIVKTLGGALHLKSLVELL